MGCHWSTPWLTKFLTFCLYFNLRFAVAWSLAFAAVDAFLFYISVYPSYLTTQNHKTNADVSYSLVLLWVGTPVFVMVSWLLV